jgi:ribosomal small subunit protein bTHX
MGKGDIRTKKGKTKNGSFGRSRNKRVLKAKNNNTKKAA